MALVQLAVAPDGRFWIGRADAIVAIDPPFAWSPSLQARTVRLAHGESLIVLDTPANVAAVLSALDPAGSNVRPATEIPAPPSVGSA